MKLTKWEAGNELIKAADAVGECIDELKKDWPALANDLREIRKQISEIYDTNDFVKEMGFGI